MLGPGCYPLGCDASYLHFSKVTGSEMEDELLGRERLEAGNQATSKVQARSKAALTRTMAMGIKTEVATLTHGDLDGTVSHF